MGTDDSNDGRGGERTLSNPFRTFGYLITTLHLKLLPHIFNRITLLLDELYHLLEFASH